MQKGETKNKEVGNSRDEAYQAPMVMCEPLVLVELLERPIAHLARKEVTCVAVATRVLTQKKRRL